MKIKNLIENSGIKLKTKVTNNGERFNVAVQLNLSKEELLSLGLSEPKVKRKEGVKVSEPTLKELMLQGFSNINKQITEVRKDIAQLDTRVSVIDARVVALDERVAIIERELKEVREIPSIQNEIKNSKSKNR